MASFTSFVYFPFHLQFPCQFTIQYGTKIFRVCFKTVFLQSGVLCLLVNRTFAFFSGSILRLFVRVQPPESEIPFFRPVIWFTDNSNTEGGAVLGFYGPDIEMDIEVALALTFVSLLYIISRISTDDMQASELTPWQKVSESGLKLLSQILNWQRRETQYCVPGPE